MWLVVVIAVGVIGWLLANIVVGLIAAALTLVISEIVERRARKRRRAAREQPAP